MLYRVWAVPPTPCKYDKHYKNPVLEETFLYEFELGSFLSSSPGESMRNTGIPRTSFSKTGAEGEKP